MILAIAVALATAQAGPCPDEVTAQAFVCRAIRASADHKPEAAAEAFEQAAHSLDESNPETSRLWAAAGNMWISAGRPGKAAYALDRALAGSGLQAEQRGLALLDRARAAEAQNDHATARSKTNEAAATISEDPFLWYFSAALAIREGDGAEAKNSIARALALAPADPVILFEAGHVAQFSGDLVGARHYWTRAAELDPKGPAGRQARQALRLLPAQLTVQSRAAPAK
jgi:tetratricopeptide (TPR) repeat protein